MRTIFTFSVCLALGASGLASAQNYSGVSPGSNVVPVNIAAAPGAAAMVTWPGFQVLGDGRTRVFVQTSSEVKPELKQEGANWLVVIPGVALPQGNARLPLDTSFFNTPVKTTRMKPREEGGVVVVLEMRAKVTPKVRTEKAPNGYFFTYIEFPAGTYNK